MIQQVAQRDLRRGGFVGDAKAGQVALHGRVQVELAGLDQLHDRHAGHRFAKRGELERGLGRDWPPVGAGNAEALEMDDLVALDDAERQAGDAQLAHLPLDVGVDCGEAFVPDSVALWAGCATTGAAASSRISTSNVVIVLRVMNHVM